MKKIKLGTQFLIARHGMNDNEGMTLKGVSEGTGIMPHTIRAIEKNKGNPKLNTLVTLARFYGGEIRIV
jgi:DNA-binding XRE family transcriptional regulator